MNRADVTVNNEGTIVLFWLHTATVRDWWAEHVQDGFRFDDAYVVESRYASDLVNGLAVAGFQFTI